MGRKWLNFLSAGSLLLCLMLIAAWVGSYFVMPAWNIRGTPDTTGMWNDYSLRLARGRIWYGWQLNGGFGVLMGEGHQPDFAGLHFYRVTKWSQPFQTFAMSGTSFAGFVHLTDTRPNPGRRMVGVPVWPLGVLSGLLPGTWLLRRIRRRGRSGICVGCGYDLRATPDRCPECGTVPASIET